MERQQWGDNAGRGRSDVSAELRRRATAAKPAALIVRRALHNYTGDGTTTTALDVELDQLPLDPDVAAVARRALTHADNNGVTNWVHQEIDPVVMLSEQQGLPPGWDPGKADLAPVVRVVVSRGCDYAKAVRRMWEDFFALPPRRTRRLRIAVWPDAAAELEQALMAEFLCGTVDPVGADQAALDRILPAAQERLICRYSVANAVQTMKVGAAGAEAAAWEEALKVPMRAYGMIEELDDGPATEAQVRRAGDLERLARRWASAFGGVDEGLLLAILKVTLRSYGLKLLDSNRKIKNQWKKEEPTSTLVDPEGQSTNTALDRARGTPPYEPDSDERLDGDRARLVHELLVSMTADDGDSDSDDRVAPPDGSPGGATLARDIVRLLWLCHVVTQGDARGWLATWYRPITQATPLRPRTIWSLCQAVRPHYVLWPGYPEGPNDRVRGFVSAAQKELRTMALETDIGALLEGDVTDEP